MNDISAAVARNLRAVRAERGVSLSDLARRSGIAKGTVSKLERGVDTNPTVETLWALADALGVHLSQLILTEAPAAHVERAADADWITGDGLTARVLDRLSNRQVHDLSEVRFERRRKRRAGPHAPGAVAHVFVVEGRLRVGPEDASIDLDPGDYAAFSADLPHSYVAPRGRARALVVMSMPRNPPSPSGGYVSDSLLGEADAATGSYQESA